MSVMEETTVGLMFLMMSAVFFAILRGVLCFLLSEEGKAVMVLTAVIIVGLCLLGGLSYLIGHIICGLFAMRVKKRKKGDQR